MDPAAFWNERFADVSFKYGTQPNAFLASHQDVFPAGGTLLSLGEGEGRNAVWLAQQGFAVTAYDASTVGLAKLAKLAAERRVSVEAACVDLAEAELGEARWDGIFNIYCHLPSALRQALYPRLRAALKPGGVYLCELFAPDQLEGGYKSGGPREPDLFPTLEELTTAFEGFELRLATHAVVQLKEGNGHRGMGAVHRLIALKPAKP